MRCGEIVKDSQRELPLRVTCLISLIAELPLNGKFQITRRHGFGGGVSCGRFFVMLRLHC
jgi:hypothetical protein